MIIKRCIKDSFTVIGKEGSTNDGNGFIAKLWNDANCNFNEIKQLSKKDKDNNLVGIWGLMSDFSRNFNPWSNNFSEGLYLAGIEVNDLSICPNGWSRWTVPSFEYLYLEVSNDRGCDIKNALAHLIDIGEQLAGAIQDFTDPKDGKNYMYFPIKRFKI